MALKNGFNWTDFDALRRVPFATMGIFMSALCPVRCEHCAVNATPHSKEIPAHSLVRSVEEMSQLPDLVAVAITGGEPFYEIDLLRTLVDLLGNAGKRIVVYTSGYWGREEILPKVIPILRAIDGLILGIDLYHRAHIPDETLINALQHASMQGIWITAQVLTGIESQSHLDYARDIMVRSFGRNWESQADIDECLPIASGRAKKKKGFVEFPFIPDGFCHSINGPTLLRDGSLAACCNEEIVRYQGSHVLLAQYRNNFQQSLEQIKSNPLLHYLRVFPPAALFSLAAHYSRFPKVSQPKHMCEACWKFIDLYTMMEDAQRKNFGLTAHAFLDAWEERRECSSSKPGEMAKANKFNNV